jgi:hypothetical protein
MAPRISAEMLRAIQMIKDGANRYEAAKATGLTITAITRSKLYKEFIEAQKQEKKTTEG